MNRDLTHYIHHLKGFQSLELCNKVMEEIKDITYKQHTFYNVNTNQAKPRSGSQELSISFDNVPSKKPLQEKLWHAIKDYQNKHNLPWFKSWQGYSSIRFNKYSENKKMALHCDHIHSLFEGDRKGIPILSMLGGLNNDYEGGEFVIFDDLKIDLKAGDVLLFPSLFLYPHKVEPVTKGTRYSYISWVW